MSVETTAPVAAKTEDSSKAPDASKSEDSKAQAKHNADAAAARIAFEAKEAKYKADLAERDKELATLRNKGKSADELLVERDKELETTKKQLEASAKERDSYRAYTDEALKPRVDALPKELQESLSFAPDYEAKLKMLKNFEAIAKTAKAPVQGGVVPVEGPDGLDLSSMDVYKHGANALKAIEAAKRKYPAKVVDEALTRYHASKPK